MTVRYDSLCMQHYNPTLGTEVTPEVWTSDKLSLCSGQLSGQIKGDDEQARLPAPRTGIQGEGWR